MKWKLRRARRPGAHQRVFEYVRHERRLRRWFKAGIVGATCLAVAAVLALVPRGRYLTAATAARARDVARYALDLPTPRDEIDARWRRYRELGIAECQGAWRRFYNEVDSNYQRLIRYAGLDPGHGVLRWGNFNVTLLLPSTIVEPDDSGRSYRLRPNARSIWLRNLTLESGVLMFFLVPDGPGLADAIRGTTAIVVETSRQTTNSWGLRGPEPDLEAPLRGIVLGDSYMQGLFIGDDETPPEQLRRYLESRLHERASILNTGVLGYSPEQYYYSFKEFTRRFPPDFVVVSVFTNDFGDIFEVPMKGNGDWAEGKYWLEKITDECRSKRWPFVIVPAPFAPHMFGKRKSGNYPGRLSNVLDMSGLNFLDPIDDFINAFLKLEIEGRRLGARPTGCPLFNEAIGDGHFSALGARAWAESVGRRLVLLLEKSRLAETDARAPDGRGPALRGTRGPGPQKND